MKKIALLSFILLTLCLVVIGCTAPCGEHDMTERVSVPATCTEEGEMVYQCVRCGYEETAPIATISHTVGDWTVEMESTCLTQGVHYRACIWCGKVFETEPMEKLAHVLDGWIVDKEATCSKEGLRHKECRLCGNKFMSEAIPTLPHNTGGWVVDREPTCARAGVQHKSCATCYATLEVGTEIAKLPHKFQNSTCTVCGASEHTDLYMSNVSTNKMIEYFNEMCFDSKKDFIVKWKKPIYYKFYGKYSESDAETVELLCKYLNEEVSGFPGIYEATSDSQVNLELHFTDTYNDFKALMSHGGTNDTSSYMLYYDDNRAVTKAVICFRSDIVLGGVVRRSMVLSRIYNCLGPLQNSSKREYGLTYKTQRNTWLSREDEVIIKMLYDPRIKPNMKKDESAEVIRVLYH